MSSYQENALKFARPQVDKREEIAHACIGLAEETGEVLGEVKKELYFNRRTEHIKEELGDVLWYISYLAYLYGLTLDEVMAHNLDKLQRRYPNV